jgi:chemotaxis protein MotB
MMKRRKRHHEDEHADETWLLPYSDMLTLLLALFIVMFAMSEVDNQKFVRLSQQFNIIFSSSVLPDGGSSTVPSETAAQTDVTNGLLEGEKMNEVKSMLDAQIKELGYSDKVLVELNEKGLDISIQDVVLFNSGEAEILREYSPLLLNISVLLKDLDNDIEVAGYTDNVPINNVKFRSNWELSSMRAINVMNFMVGEGKLPPDRFSIKAYGEYNPRFDNSTAEGKAKNRRIEIFVARNYPASAPQTN